jgi:hypothetical protein
MNILTKFLVSRVSGWMAIAGMVAVLSLGAVVTKVVYDYKELQRQAAYCEGRESMLDIVKPLEERIIKDIEQQDEEIIEELENERDSETPDKGCAGERAPESILRYHGLRE